MYCVRCGSSLKSNANFCTRCGAMISRVGTNNTTYVTPVTNRVAVPQVVYEEEKPMESILSNKIVVMFVFCVFFLSIITIVCTSIITNDLPSMDKLDTVVTSKSPLFK